MLSPKVLSNCMAWIATHQDRGQGVACTVCGQCLCLCLTSLLCGRFRHLPTGYSWLYQKYCSHSWYIEGLVKWFVQFSCQFHLFAVFIIFSIDNKTTLKWSPTIQCSIEILNWNMKTWHCSCKTMYFCFHSIVPKKHIFWFQPLNKSAGFHCT